MENGPPAFEKAVGTYAGVILTSAEQELTALTTWMVSLEADSKILEERLYKLKTLIRRLGLRKAALVAYVEASEFSVTADAIEREIAELKAKIEREKDEIPF